MAATFCLRLAWGLIASMLLLPTGETPPRFFRVQYLIALGLLAAAWFFLGDDVHFLFGTALASSLVICCVGSIVWHVEGAPKSTPILYLAVVEVFLVLLFAVCLPVVFGLRETIWMDLMPGLLAAKLADELSSAALLGSCTSAMLMGHSYLIAPAMSLRPLMRLLGAMGGALLIRFVLASVNLALQIQSFPAGVDNEISLLLAMRWGLGFVGVLALGWMAWESARIRSTQSATGILYVVVIFCFLGELTDQLLELRLTEMTSPFGAGPRM